MNVSELVLPPFLLYAVTVASLVPHMDCSEDPFCYIRSALKQCMPKAVHFTSESYIKHAWAEIQSSLIIVIPVYCCTSGL